MPTQLPKPKSGGKPKKIGADMTNPGGPHTPGAKAAFAAAEKRRKNQSTDNSQ
jgi:hypothetical protein